MIMTTGAMNAQATGMTIALILKRVNMCAIAMIARTVAGIGRRNHDAEWKPLPEPYREDI